MVEVMFRRWLVLLLMVMSVGARAQPASLSAATTNAEAAANAAEHQVEIATKHRAALKQRYEREVAEIDRLKKQRASWRRDRELRDSLSVSLETSKRLDNATREVDQAQRDLVSARRAYLSAVESELKAGGASPARAQRLERARVLLMSQLRDPPHRILIPDLRIDPLADPEELLQRAAELRAIEEELLRQLDELAEQAVRLERAAQLRKQHDRAGDLVARDDGQSHRNPGRREGAVQATGGSPPGDSTLVPIVDDTSAADFESYMPTVLADVIDASTINSFVAAQLSGDPTQRAQAARKAHDAVALRLDQVRRKRMEMEARARRLLAQKKP